MLETRDIELQKIQNGEIKPKPKPKIDKEKTKEEAFQRYEMSFLVAH